MPIFDATPDNPNPRLGWVYVLTSPTVRSDGGVPILKIGATRKHPIQRAKEVSAGTGVATPFSLAYYRDYEDAFLAERLIHEAFAGCRVNESREFFEVAIADVVTFMESLTKGDAYQEAVASSGLIGGDWVERGGGSCRYQGPQVATPFADLFATFEDRGDGILNATEQAACRQLERETTRG